MSRTRLIFFVLLIALPALLFGGAVVYLLGHEQERIERRFHEVARLKAETLANQLATDIDTVQEDLLGALARIESDQLLATLTQQHASNPLIRNVFLWDGASGLRYPDPQSPSTREEQEFLKRFDSLFRGRSSFTPGRENEGPAPESNKVSVGSLALKKQAQLDLAEEDGASHGGWKRWFWEEQLYLLGWYRDPGTDWVRGLELEMMSLFASLLPSLAVDPGEGLGFALLDGNGRIFHVIHGNPNPDRKPELLTPVGEMLPHWQIAVYSGGLNRAATGKGFLLAGSLLALLLVGAIILSGLGMLLQAHRNLLDARQKTNFVSNVSHELKTPLTSIRMYAELLGQNRVKDPAKREKHLKVIVSESERLTRLVNNVLEFSRLEQGRKKTRLQRLDLKAFMEELLAAQSLRIQKAGMRLETDFPESGPMVRTDRDALEQVVLNLLDNALKYAKHDETQSQLAERNVITVSLAAKGTGAELRIRDRGPGISKAYREKIFEKFFRIDESLASGKTGSGIGLSIARGLLRHMGGELRYEPPTDPGSCFVAILPMAPEPAGTA